MIDSIAGSPQISSAKSLASPAGYCTCYCICPIVFTNFGIVSTRDGNKDALVGDTADNTASNIVA